jgi:hypothetical protein
MLRPKCTPVDPVKVMADAINKTLAIPEVKNLLEAQVLLAVAVCLRNLRLIWMERSSAGELCRL